MKWGLGLLALILIVFGAVPIGILTMAAVVVAPAVAEQIRLDPCSGNTTDTTSTHTATTGQFSLPKGGTPRHQSLTSPAQQIPAQIKTRKAGAVVDAGDSSGCFGYGGDLPGFDGSCSASGSAAERGLRATALRGLRCAKQAFPAITSIGGRRSSSSSTCRFSDHCTGLAVDFMIPKWNSRAGNAFGWRVAHWVQAHAKQLRVKYIIWDVQKWNPSAGAGWRPYRHPYGNSNPTLAHKNHVHVSFYPPR